MQWLCFMIVAGGGSLGAGEGLSSSRQPCLWVPDLEEVALWVQPVAQGPHIPTLAGTWLMLLQMVGSPELPSWCTLVLRVAIPSS